ncbi:MAG TPA: mechanosensitive ion channel domain-containing protein [Acetobacteraceae bacterium]|nr:mechanosensitive ion channel domain-containing protein [Acetobacteraceae bacterium]
MRSSTLLLFLCLILAIPAHAQGVGKSPSPSGVSPAEAQLVLDVLNNPQKRTQFTTTLQAIVKGLPAAGLATKSQVPLAPDSLGAELIVQSSGWFAGLSHQTTALGHALGSVMLIWRWLNDLAQDPDMRASVIATAWRAALVLACALATERAGQRLLRRPEQRITELAGDLPAEGNEPEPPPGLPDASEELVERHRRLNRVLRQLRRLPFVLVRLLLHLLPVGAFALVGYVGTEISRSPDDDTPRLVLLALVNAYIAYRVATSLTRMLVAPRTPRLRLVHISDDDAAYALRWVRRLAAVAAFGYASSEIGVLFDIDTAAHDALLKLVVLIDHVFLVIIVFQIRSKVAARLRARPGATGVIARVRLGLSRVWHIMAAFWVIALWLVWAARVQDGYLKLWHIFLVTVAVLIVARLIAIMLHGALDRGFHSDNGLGRRATCYYPALRGGLDILLGTLTLLTLLETWGVHAFAWFGHNPLGNRLVSALITIGIAVFGAVVVWEGTNISMDRHLARLTREAQMIKSARFRTLAPILRTALLCAILVVVALTVLSEIGVNIGPLLAGAGILGVAIGFGSQKLVQDFITGIFLLMENAMQVGDWVTVAGLSGSVENLSIRTLRLRAGDGSVHIIPFSSVSTVTNINRGVGNAEVSVTVSLREDPDHVGEVLRRIAIEMREKSPHKEMMRSDLQLWGVDKIEHGGMTIVGQIVCTDTGRWGVQREFNRRMKKRLDDLGIEIATPVQTVLLRGAPLWGAGAHTPSPGQTAQKPDAAGKLVASPPPAALGHTE